MSPNSLPTFITHQINPTKLRRRRGRVVSLSLTLQDVHGHRAIAIFMSTILVLLLLFNVYFYVSLPLGLKENDAYDGIFVISLDGAEGADEHNLGRLSQFKTKLAQACEGSSGNQSTPRVEYCPGVIDKRRGYGLTRSWLGCLEKARAMDLEVAIILEDDARVFDREESLLFCDAKKRRDYIWSRLPEDAFLTFIGGHSWVFANPHELSDIPSTSLDIDEPKVQYRETLFSYGTYGFAVPRQSLDLLLNTIRGDIAHGYYDEREGRRITAHLSPEKSWYGVAHTYKKKMYALHPLTVWHEGGYSNTWGRMRENITGEGGEVEKGIKSSSGKKGVVGLQKLGRFNGDVNKDIPEKFLKDDHVTLKGPKKAHN